MFIARTTIAFVAATLIAAPAFAADPAPASTPAAQETPAPTVKEKKYCMGITTTGSRIERKVCKTRDQWLVEDNLDPLAAK